MCKACSTFLWWACTFLCLLINTHFVVWPLSWPGGVGGFRVVWGLVRRLSANRINENQSESRALRLLKKYRYRVPQTQIERAWEAGLVGERGREEESREASHATPRRGNVVPCRAVPCRAGDQLEEIRRTL